LPSEAKISDATGISRSIVREALRTLAATGLIEMAAGKCAQVSKLNGVPMQNVIENAVLTGQADVRHVMEIRRGLEITMVALAAKRCTAKQAADLTAIVMQMADEISNIEEYAALDLRFHLVLAEASENPLYLMLMKACQKIFHTSMLMGVERWTHMSQMNYVQQVHEAIVAAIVARNPVTASQMMSTHFDDAIKLMFGDRSELEARRVSDNARRD
jgi:DNA-binding FadR family transcriptional regulator